MIIERLVLVLGAVLLLILVAALLKRQQLQQAKFASTIVEQPPPTNGKFHVIYFWSTQCNQCSTIQTPIINDLINSIDPDILIVTKINISESQEQAQRWGVRTVPTTYILDGKGAVQHMNNGLTTKKRLTKQLLALEDDFD